MKPLRQIATPTRHRRLNELLGVAVLVAAALLLLALTTYAPTDPSLNTVGGYAPSADGIPHPAHNWSGLAGAYLADALLQLLGVASFFLPLALARVGVCWLLARAAGSIVARSTGLLLWLVFGPAAIGLVPIFLGHRVLFRAALPIEGATGRLLADAFAHLLNLPGATIVLAMLVGISLYLATTFSFATARDWATVRFAPLQRLQDRWQNFRARRNPDEDLNAFTSKRERMEESARRAREKQALSQRLAAPPPAPATLPEPSPESLLTTLFGWLGRRNQPTLSVVPDPIPAPAPSANVWQAMPRTLVDAPPVTPFSTATAAALPFADALAKAAAPVELWEEIEPEKALEAAASFITERSPEHHAPIHFGRRADADAHPVTITPKSVRGYKLPPSSLLFRSDDTPVVREDALRDEARTLVEKCAEFNVAGQVTQINPGPVVTTFEFRPDAGVKVARITGLADDLCLAMAAESILIERMAGKSTVGIQVPNADRETIWLRDVVECESFAQSKSKLAIALGKDINGRIVTADLAAMPHVLIAGSTGSGKSVAINAMIMSVLFKSTPEQVRMILVDPKRVELGMYEGIPHLFTPIITEAKLAANALRNAVREMERRLKLLAANHVRNIDQFNKLFDHGSDYLFEDVQQEPLPYIIIIIDELADLMMLDRANVEESITRLAQMARAVGIHLVLATQRPSVDVITGLIKANVPTRMSFRLATKVDSRTIIDSNGAESLLGRGDMLYLPPGTSRVQRVHAPFVTEKEISAVTAFWRAQGEAEYVHGFLEGPKEDDGTGADGDGGIDGGAGHDDPMFDDAVRLVFEFGKASTSLLQRRLRIGYGRAAHLIDMMHNDGLVGPADGSKPRELLKSPSWISEVDEVVR